MTDKLFELTDLAAEGWNHDFHIQCRLLRVVEREHLVRRFGAITPQVTPILQEADIFSIDKICVSFLPS